MATNNATNNLPGLLIPVASTCFETTGRFSLSGTVNPTFDTNGANFSLTSVNTDTCLLDWSILSQNANATNIWTKLPWFTFPFQEVLGNEPAQGIKARIRIQANGDSTTSDTVRHMGLLIDTTSGSVVVKLSVADGTTQSTVDISSAFTSNLRTQKVVTIVYVSSSLVEVWVDGVLKGSVTTNIPTNASANVADILHFGFRNQNPNSIATNWRIPSATWGYFMRIYH